MKAHAAESCPERPGQPSEGDPDDPKPSSSRNQDLKVQDGDATSVQLTSELAGTSRST